MEFFHCHACAFPLYHVGVSVYKWGQPGLAGLTPVSIHMMRSLLHQLACLRVFKMVILCFAVLALLYLCRKSKVGQRALLSGNN